MRLRVLSCRAVWTGRNRSPPIGDVRDRARPLFLRTGRRKAWEPERAGARFLAEAWVGSRSWDQNIVALNDLRGGSSGIARPVESAKRPRQNSQDRSLIQPGSALSITWTRR